jgi:hypothetical protein
MTMRSPFDKLLVLAVCGVVLLPPLEGRAQSIGTFVTAWGTPGTGNGQFAGPRGVCVDGGVAVDASGNVYIADSINRRIQKFAPDSTFLMKWGSFGTGDGQFRSPGGITVDAGGNIYVVDTGNTRVQKFAPDSTLLVKWGTPGGGNGQFAGARDAAVDAAGNVYVTDASNNRVQKFTSDGGYLAQWGSAGSGAGSTTLRFTLAKAEGAALTVYDVQGRTLKRWSWANLAFGPQQLVSDGRMDNGRLAPNGVLFFRLETNGRTLTQKMVQLR